MPLKTIPTTGQTNWGNPLNDHLSQLSNPTTGGVNTAPFGSPTVDDEGHTYLDINTQKLYRLNSSAVYEEVLSTSIPYASSTTQLKALLEHHDIVYYDSSHWHKTTGDYSQIETDDTEDGFVVAIDNIATTSAVGIRQADHVSYDMFGADNTGTTPADIPMVAAHAVGNYFKLPLKQNNGIFLWHEERLEIAGIPCVDLHGMIVVVDENSGNLRADRSFNTPNKQMYTIAPENEYFLDASEISDLTTNYLNELKKGSANVTFSKFLEYREAMIVFKSSTNEYFRTQNRGVTLEDAVITGFQGSLSLPFAKDMDANLTEVQIIPRSTCRMVFKAPCFRIPPGATKDFMFINVERPQTDVIGLSIEELEPSSNDTVRYLIRFLHVYDCTMINAQVVGQKHTISGTYSVFCKHILRCLFDNLTGYDGWGVINTNNGKEITYQNCYVNRFDAHWSGYDSIIQNCRIKNVGILFSGGGRLSIKNCKYLVNAPSNGELVTESFFKLRTDYGNYFDGVVTLEDIEIKVSEASSFTQVSLVELRDLRYDPGGIDTYLPEKIIARDINFVVPSSKTNDPANPFECLVFDLTDMDTKNDATTNNVNYYAPELLSADTVYVTSDSNSWMLTGVKARDAHLGNLRTRQSSYVHGDYGNNCKIVLQNFYQIDFPYYIDGMGGLVDVQLPPGTAGTHYLNDPDAWIPYIYVNNCTNAMIKHTAKGLLKISNSSVRAIDDFNGSQYSTSEKYCIVDNCYVKPLVVSETNNTYKLDGDLYTNSVFENTLNHTNAVETLDINNFNGHYNMIGNGNSEANYTNIPDGFFQVSEAQVADANGANNTATINAILDSLRNQGILER